MGTISLLTVGVHMDLCQKPLKNSLLTAMFVAAVRKLFSTVRLFYHYDLDEDLKRSLQSIFRRM